MFFVCMLSSFGQGRGIGKPQRDWAGLLIKRSVIWTWIGYPKHKFARIIIVFLTARSMQRSSVDFLIEWKQAFSSCGRFPLYSSLLPAKSLTKGELIYYMSTIGFVTMFFFSLLVFLIEQMLRLKQLPSSFSPCVRLLDNPLNINNVLIY